MINNPLLETYWIEFPGIIPFGIGVTAFSREDAFRLLNALGYKLSEEDSGVRVTEGIKATDLDQNHVVPNMGPIVFRGVWYPTANL